MKIRQLPWDLELLLGPQLGPLENEYPETRFLSAFQTRGSIRGLRSASVVAVPMSPGHRATSRALNQGSSERMVLFRVQCPQTQCFQWLAGFVVFFVSQRNTLKNNEKSTPRALFPSRDMILSAET